MAIFLIDVYHGQFYPGSVLGTHAQWGKLFDSMSAGYHGAIIKCSDGLYGHEWFRYEWPRLKAAGGEHYGQDWFRGAYHFIRFDTVGGTPEQQADCYCRNVSRAGGWGAGDIYPVVDAERGAPGSRNYRADKQRVIEYVTRYAERVKATTGRPVMLYGRGIMYDLGITDHMGCAVNWNPSYTEYPHQHGLESWDRGKKLLWQYTNGKINKTSFPTKCAFGEVDCSVYLGTADDKGKDLDDFRRHLINGESAVGAAAVVSDTAVSGAVIATAGIGALIITGVV